MRYDLLDILLVDDNRHMRVLLAEILRSVGVRMIREASDGAEGLKVIVDHPLDLIITDLSMKPLDGIDFVRLLRRSQESRNKTVPVIMITGHATSARVSEARDAGVNEFLTKPLNARAILQRLHRAIEAPRPFVRHDEYAGPDRRGRVDLACPTPGRRSRD
jgi:two-component system chemotaxis response regulator CheY